MSIHSDILDQFDIIGVDIRGTGLSEAIECDLDLLNQMLAGPLWPTDQSSFDEMIERNTAFRQSCFNGSDLPHYMDTISIAKDHEAVRIALGSEPITWLGMSYGTQLAAQYAEMYPDNIRAMVLDSIYSP